MALLISDTYTPDRLFITDRLLTALAIRYKTAQMLPEPASVLVTIPGKYPHIAALQDPARTYICVSDQKLDDYLLDNTVEDAILLNGGLVNKYERVMDYILGMRC
jgi:hypothetical protein